MRHLAISLLFPMSFFACADEFCRVNYTRFEIEDVIFFSGEFPAFLPVKVKGDTSLYKNPPEDIKKIAGDRTINLLHCKGDRNFLFIVCLSRKNPSFFRRADVEGRIVKSESFPWGIYIEVDYYQPEK